MTAAGGILPGVVEGVLGVSSFLPQIVIGAVIIAAVLVDTMLKKQRS